MNEIKCVQDYCTMYILLGFVAEQKMLKSSQSHWLKAKHCYRHIRTTIKKEISKNQSIKEESLYEKSVNGIIYILY